MRYMWAAYKKGSLAPMGPQFADPVMAADEFKAAFEQWVLANCHAAWTLVGHTKRGFIPVGVVFASWAPNAPFMIISDISWLPWASKRNIIECTVAFFEGARKEFMFQGYALPEHKRMYEVCMMHGIMRRVGTSYVAIPGKPTAVFETRAA